jgi:hypothetical protein
VVLHLDTHHQNLRPIWQVRTLVARPLRPFFTQFVIGGLLPLLLVIHQKVSDIHYSKGSLPYDWQAPYKDKLVYKHPGSRSSNS